MNINTNQITEIFNNFSSLRIMVIGDVMIDSYLWGKVERISPEAPVPIVAVNKRENRPGGAANVALNLTALGAVPILCSVVGDDAKGILFRELIQSLHLSDKGIITTDDKNRITTTKFRVIGNNTQMLRVDEETDNFISKYDEKKLIDTICSILKNEKIHAVIFEDYDKGVITPKLIHEITTVARSISIPVIADPKQRNFNEYKNLSLFKPNLKELKEGLKIDSFDSPADIENAVDLLQLNNNIDMVMVTLSEAGMYVSSINDKDKFLKKMIPSHIRNIADVSGAGDTVISVAALCLALNIEPEITASLSNLAGGLVCEDVGVVPVNKEKLLNEAIKLLK
ncbi:MAG: bifunctional ADP-heptose synthase [Bacteroidota bacterium]